MDCIVSAPGHLRCYFPPVDWEGVFDTFEVSRSRGGDGGPFEPLMGMWWRPASFSLPVHNAYDVVGRHLLLLIDGRVEVDVEFSDSTPASVAAAIGTAMPGMLKSEIGSDGVIRFYGAQLGLGAAMRVDGDAAPLLGLVPGDEHYGVDGWRRLVRDTYSYDFIDPRGLEADFYRVRLFDSINPESYLQYLPFPGTLRGGLDAEHLIEGYIQLFDLTGRPVEQALVSLYASQRAYPPDGNAGMFPASVDIKTDRMGRARTQLVRGARMTLSISGTNMAREILVPNEGREFDLLDPAVSVDDDAYRVQVPNILVGERRTL